MKFIEFMKDNWKKVYEEYNDSDKEWKDPEQPQPSLKKEINSDKKKVKQFNVGDVLKLVDNRKSSKLPLEAYEFLMTYKKFTVLKITPSGKLDLGCRISKNTPEGGVEKFFIFGPDRFELLEPSKSNIKPLEVDEDGIVADEGEW